MLLSIKSLGAKIALKEGDGVIGGAGVVATFRHFEIIRKMYDVSGSLYKTMRENKAIYFFRGECTFKMIPKGFKAKNVALAQLAKLKSTFPPREFGSIPFLAL